MQYELLKDSDVGIIIDPMPIMRDVKDTFAVSFVLPDEGAYVALFRDESGVEYRTTIKNNEAHVPNKLLNKEQLIGLTVCQIYDDKITHIWECQSLKIGTFLSLRQTQWQITSGIDDKALLKRLAEIEHRHSQTLYEFAEIKKSLELTFDDLMQQDSERQEQFSNQMQKQEQLEQKIIELTDKYNAAVEKFNMAVEAVNNLSEQVKELQANYDPTVVKQ